MLSLMKSPAPAPQGLSFILEIVAPESYSWQCKPFLNPSYSDSISLTDQLPKLLPPITQSKNTAEKQSELKGLLLPTSSPHPYVVFLIAYDNVYSCILQRVLDGVTYIH